MPSGKGAQRLLPWVKSLPLTSLFSFPFRRVEVAPEPKGKKGKINLYPVTQVDVSLALGLRCNVPSGLRWRSLRSARLSPNRCLAGLPAPELLNGKLSRRSRSAVR